MHGFPSANGPVATAWRVAVAFLWLAIAVAACEFVVVAWTRYHDLASQAYAMFASRHGWLWVHLAGGAVALLLGPVQFVAPWRRRWPRLHRVLGRVYLCGVLVGLVGATGLVATSPAPGSIRVAFAVTASAWLATGFAGYVAIRRGDVAAHRRWMVRTYAVTLAPVVFRTALRCAVALGVAPSPTVIALLLWASWMVPLAGCEVVRKALARTTASGRRADPALPTSAA